MALFAVEGPIDDVAGVGERRRQLPVEIRIVLDHEETHRNTLPRWPKHGFPIAAGITILLVGLPGSDHYRSLTRVPVDASTVARRTLPSRGKTVSW
jgi:hypothetical protein